jgi:hypothetical protein
MVVERRGRDQFAILDRWATRRVQQHPRLADAPFDAQLAYFVGLLPSTTVGLHALAHIRWSLWREALATSPWRQRRELASARP